MHTAASSVRWRLRALRTRVAAIALGVLALVWLVAPRAHAWTTLVLSQPTDVDLVRTDLGVFNHSSTLIVYADSLVWPTTVVAAEATCGPTAALFRWTPFRVRANWSFHGWLGAWTPVDAPGRRVAARLDWWVCPDVATAAHPRVWRRVSEVAPEACHIATAAPNDGAVDAAVTYTRVCYAGTYVLAADTCTDGAPFGADCIRCAPGWYGCACEFQDASFHRTDAATAAVTWTVATLMALPYAVDGVRGAVAARRGSSAPPTSRDDTLMAHAFATLVAAALVLAQAIDTAVVRPGHNLALARASLAFACVFLLASLARALHVLGVPVLGALGRALFKVTCLCCRRRARGGKAAAQTPTSAAATPRPSALLVRGAWAAVTSLSFMIGAVLWTAYMAPRASILVATCVLMAALAVAQILQALLPLRFWWISLICAVLNYVYVMPIWDAPCAGTTTVDG